MMQIYDQDSKPLIELLQVASSEQGATLLVPDLQRPYVWTPNQVILLVDSLLRGWPFGTLLLWEVRRDDLATIPSRSFWRVVDRTGDSPNDEVVSKSHPPAEFRMVLDGQQRLQSLLLAFAGDAWGFRLLDREWSEAMESEKPRGRYARKHWSMAHLCLDLPAFRDAIAVEPELCRLEFRDVLTWAVTAPSGGRSAFKRPPNYKHPVASALDSGNKGRFIRLSRFWTIAASRTGTLPRHYRDEVRHLLADHEVAKETRDLVEDPLSELVFALSQVQQEKVSYLWLKPFNERDLAQDAYNDAIVNIFTRLNTAGRTLTRQEITFAWIKTGWNASKTADRTAGQCFDDLSEELAGAGVELDADTLVGAISVMWSVLFRNGELLSANDLLRGEKVNPMAQDLVEHWETIANNAVDAAAVVKSRGFVFDVHYRSQNVLTLLITWRLLSRQWLKRNPQNVTGTDSFEKATEAVFNGACDRWIIMSQWSGRWGKSTDKSLAEYVKDLASDWSRMAALSKPEDVVEVLHSRMNHWLAALQSDSLRHIDDLAVADRRQVHQYFLPLWLWHRLDQSRWEASDLPLRTSKRGALRLDVDHLVPVKIWEKLSKELPEIDAGDQDQLEELTREDVSVIMNSFGNCCLLEKSFNISKGADPLKLFLEKVHDFKTGIRSLDEWITAVGVTEEIFDPVSHEVESVVTAVRMRTDQMKRELSEFVRGERPRVDSP